MTVPDISNPFFASVIRGVEETVQAAGYSVLLGDTRQNPEREAEYARMFHRREADGLIFLGHRLPEVLRRLVADAQVRLAIVNGGELDPDNDVSCVGIDNAAAAFCVMEHLHRLGHRKIAILAGRATPLAWNSRLTGVHRFVDQCTDPVEITVWNSAFIPEAGLEQALLALSQDERPTALFCFNDELAIGALVAARRLGLRCPEDVSIVGFDDIRYAAMMEPPLTTLRQPMVDLGREAARVLLDILDGTMRSKVSIELPYELIVRGSTAAPVSK